jgi:hypothetical protein
LEDEMLPKHKIMISLERERSNKVSVQIISAPKTKVIEKLQKLFSDSSNVKIPDEAQMVKGPWSLNWRIGKHCMR